MSLFTQDTIERVREASDIVEIVSAYTDLRRAGDSFSGLCPFHEERTPSFSVNAREKLYYCFGCEAGGDVIKFVVEKEGLSFPEAVEALAERYGVEIEREQEDPQAEQERKRRQRLFQLLERTSAFYVSFLWESPKAKKARDYLTGRGLGEDVLKAFSVGFAPSDWGVILERGQRAGFSIEELRQVGLIQKNREGNVYDKFRSRVMFPIRDSRGRTVGFGGRILKQAERVPKYMNSPEGELYRKGEILFGIDLARGAIGKTERAVVVEGYTDVLAMHQAGISETVAVMGTAITAGQLGALAGTNASEVVLALDPDKAGREAMLRVQGKSGKARGGDAREIRLRVAATPGGADPADVLLNRDESERESAIRELTQALDESVDIRAFHVRSILEEADLASPVGRDRALEEVVPVLAGMGDPISRADLVRGIADQMDVSDALIVAEIKRQQVQNPGTGKDRPAELRKARLTAIEQRERALLAMCVASPALGRTYLDKLTPSHLTTKRMVQAVEWLRDNLTAPLDGIPEDDQDFRALITQLFMRSENEPASEEAMEINFLELEQRMVEQQIESAQRDGGGAPVELQRRRAELAERIARRQAAAR